MIIHGLEVEVAALLGRARYQRAADCPDARAGTATASARARDHRPAVTVVRPKLRGTTEAFCSRLFGAGVTRSNALESLVIAGFVRGVSIRNVEARLPDALGAEAALSKSTVSTVCQAIRDELDAGSARRLDEFRLDFLFLDASMFKVHAGSRAEVRARAVLGRSPAFDREPCVWYPDERRGDQSLDPMDCAVSGLVVKCSIDFCHSR